MIPMNECHVNRRYNAPGFSNFLCHSRRVVRDRIGRRVNGQTGLKREQFSLSCGEWRPHPAFERCEHDKAVMDSCHG